MSDIQVGDTATLEQVVTRSDTADSLGSGDVAVLATPRAIAWAEAATCAAVADRLEPQETTVGSAIGVEHSAPTRIGETVVVTAVVAQVDRRRVLFDVTLVNPDGVTALSGTVTRVVVDRDQFA
ncbi:MAG: hotdog domain-containing protein [Candidatus Nanopelagicales bacterium]